MSYNQLSAAMAQSNQGTLLGDCVRRRFVRVFVSDPDPDLALADAVLYAAPEQVTDLNDNELFLEIGIPALLAAHNAKRAAQELDPIKARDLRLAVATLVYI